jgi:hypothetical protein
MEVIPRFIDAVAIVLPIWLVSRYRLLGIALATIAGWGLGCLSTYVYNRLHLRLGPGSYLDQLAMVGYGWVLPLVYAVVIHGACTLARRLRQRKQQETGEHAEGK